MNSLKTAREYLEQIKKESFDEFLVENKAAEALDALEEVRKYYTIGRLVMMRPMVVHQAINDWHARIDHEGKVYSASGDTASEAIVNLAEEVFS